MQAGKKLCILLQMNKCKLIFICGDNPFVALQNPEGQKQTKNDMKVLKYENKF